MWIQCQQPLLEIDVERKALVYSMLIFLPTVQNKCLWLVWGKKRKKIGDQDVNVSLLLRNKFFYTWCSAINRTLQLGYEDRRGGWLEEHSYHFLLVSDVMAQWGEMKQSWRNDLKLIIFLYTCSGFYLFIYLFCCVIFSYQHQCHRKTGFFDFFFFFLSSFLFCCSFDALGLCPKSASQEREF